MHMLLMIVWVIEEVKNECPRVFELNVLVHFHRLCLEMRVDGFPEPTESFAGADQCYSFISGEKFTGTNHSRTISEYATLFFHYFSSRLRAIDA